MESYEESNSQASLLDEIDTDAQCDDLCEIGSESVDGQEYITRHSRSDGCGIITIVRLLEFISKIIETIECDDDFKITETFLDFGADAS